MADLGVPPILGNFLLISTVQWLGYEFWFMERRKVSQSWCDVLVVPGFRHRVWTFPSPKIHVWPSQKNPPTPLWRWRRAYGGEFSHTKCSITFVNIAVAISALAGGGGEGQKRFGTERWCLRDSSTLFGCLSLRGYWNGILGHFGKLPAMEKRTKMKKHRK